MSVTTVKRIVCLANSRKGKEQDRWRCIAGKELLADGQIGDWIRPVSARKSQGVSKRERRYEDGSDPRPLDVIDVPLLKPQPQDYQQENWLLDPEARWERIRRVAGNELARFTDPIAPLWTDGHSTTDGKNDRVPLSVARSLEDSLRFIKVDRLELFVSPPWWVQGRFHYAEMDYWLKITDPIYIYERPYLQKPGGDYQVQVGEAFLTVSLGKPLKEYSYKLGKPLKEYSYKLIAAVIQP